MQERFSEPAHHTACVLGQARTSAGPLGVCQRWSTRVFAICLQRRLVLSHLITNVDDHLQNIGFLYTGRKQWQLAPAFDLNPFPDKSPESKTWLREDTGPIISIDQLLSKATYFELTPPQAEAVVAEVKHAVKNWKAVAASPDVGMQAAEMKAFEAAFKEAFV